MQRRIEEDEEGVLFHLRLQPGARADEVVGWMGDGYLKVRVRSRPVEGAANRALLEVLASVLAVRRRDLALVRGETSRIKAVRCRRDVAAKLLEIPSAPEAGPGS